MNVIDKHDFLTRITNMIGHLDSFDQNVCRATLTGQLVAMLPNSALDTVLKLFAEHVQTYHSELPELRRLKEGG